ncbi:unnamed protein product [Bursaphelenchus okinawaensis]|uniref:UBC core domain-containing protein n=1 Tax=Bursaphelenchus okinawaensis TaxID=465554 RepID=A0A811K176_9BILA|nr:unnamed protein product [Bursaphelenchus okinawaensis]CAG9088831.1 unnamed protein product [Bursaphelenchus okinawaensis]
MSSNLNTRSAGVKRLLQEAKELHKPTYMFYAKPLEDNLFEWHFTFRGPPDTDYEGGIYHGRIILPHEYPMKPPNVVLLTPNGRFETHTKICLSISGYHPETWLPSWSIRTAILALIGFFPTDGAGALGSIECSSAVRKRLATQSVETSCETCGCCLKNVLLPTEDSESSQKPSSSGDKSDIPQSSFAAPKPSDGNVPRNSGHDDNLPSGHDDKASSRHDDKASSGQDDKNDKPNESEENPSSSTTTTDESRPSSQNSNRRQSSPPTIRSGQAQRPRPNTPIPLNVMAFGICICFAAFVGLLARKLTF